MGHVTMDCKLGRGHIGNENPILPVGSIPPGAPLPPGAGAPNIFMHGAVPAPKFPAPPFANNINAQQQCYEKLKMDQVDMY